MDKSCFHTAYPQANDIRLPCYACLNIRTFSPLPPLHLCTLSSYFSFFRNFCLTSELGFGFLGGTVQTRCLSTQPPLNMQIKSICTKGRAAKVSLEFTDEPSTVALLLSSGVSRSCITTHSSTNSDSQPDLKITRTGIWVVGVTTPNLDRIAWGNLWSVNRLLPI